MKSFSKRSADVFDALDRLQPSQSKEETPKRSTPVDKEFRRPQGVYTPPAKQLKTSPPCSQSGENSSCSESNHTHTHAHHHRHSASRHYKDSHGYSRRQRTPQHKDSTKWTKYDLREDGTKQMTGLSDEQINRRVAYQFLDQLKKRNQSQEEEPAASDAKIVFKTPTRAKADSKDNTKAVFKKPTEIDVKEKLIGGEGVRVMPEYIVGMSGAGRRKRPLVTLSEETRSGEGVSECDSKPEDGRTKSRKSKQSAVTLSHLEDCDD